jgi:molybdenum cofactor synthesis domain-containing protein
MRPFTSTISLEDALAHIAAAARPIGRVESLPLSDALGRVLAEDVPAPADVPPFARAAMDGYAVVAADVATASPGQPAMLRCVGTVFAGQAPSMEVAHGTCVEIATGAPLPPGATAVVMVEDTSKDDDRVRITAVVHDGHNTSAAGTDVKTGDLVGRAGELLLPSRLGALAAAGRTHARVFTRPRVAIISTGNELVPPGAVLGPGQIYDINRFTLAGVVRQHGGEPVDLPTVGDALEPLEAAVEAAAAFDLAIFSGGSSVGDRDLMQDALRARGTVAFHGVAVRPGKPTALVQLGDTVVLAMPGNPTSCLSNAYVFLVPLLRLMARLPAYRPHEVRATLAARVASAAGRHQFYSVRLDGTTAIPAFRGSGAITSLSRADGYIEIPASVAAFEAGDSVVVKLFQG